MKNTLVRLRFPAIASAILVAPLMMLEWVNRQSYHEVYPLALFGVLWILPTTFSFILISIGNKARAGKNILENPVRLLLSIAACILTAWLWASIIRDQLPCFLGVLNCD